MERGLRPEDIGLIPAAAGGPKGLVLSHLDRLLFGGWLQGDSPLHLVGASIGAWRMTTACLPGDAVANFASLAEAYITQQYDPEPGEKKLRAAPVSAKFEGILAGQFKGREPEVLAHSRHRLHIVASRGKGPLLAREGRLRTPLGYLGAYAANLLHRPWLGHWMERVVFSDPRQGLPLALNDFATHQARLSPTNLRPALLASCSIPFWLAAQQDLPEAPRGAYWDGGITDYHLHLDYRALMGTGAPLVLYPHFQREVVPGWLDKALKRRHRPSPFLDNLVLLVPRLEWIQSLPGGKLPDRKDFIQLPPAERMQRWRVAVAESERLAESFLVQAARDSLQPLPL
ncbi:MAG: phospholipase [Burkholderiales bacterium]|nr:phospholipase [Burkholderiales bacterium]